METTWRNQLLGALVGIIIALVAFIAAPAIRGTTQQALMLESIQTWRSEVSRVVQEDHSALQNVLIDNREIRIQQQAMVSIVKDLRDTVESLAKNIIIVRESLARLEEHSRDTVIMPVTPMKKMK